MKRSVYFLVGILAVYFVFCVLGSPAIAAEKTYTMKGKIAFVNEKENIVVVDVPLANGTFRVAGPLASDAVLKKGKGPATLADFKVGEKVTVRWKATAKGHLIEFLKIN